MLTRPLKMGSPVIPFLLLILSIAVWTEMDLFVPSLPEVMRYFWTTEQVIQWTFSFNFFGFFISSLFCGALSDVLGRRIVILVGTALFVCGSFFTVTASSIEMFLLGRLIQGIGVSAPAVVTMAIMADLYEGTAFVRWTSLLNCCVTITMALAPICGAYLTQYFGWRSNFGVIAGLAVLGLVLVYVFVPETLHKQHRKAFHLKTLIGNYKKLLMSRKFMNPMMGLGFLITPYFVFVGIISLLYLNELKLPMNEYVMYQGSIVAVFAFFSLLVSILGDRIDLDRWVAISIWACIAVSGCLLLHGLFLPDNAFSLTSMMCVFAAACVVPCTVLYVRAIAVFPELQASSSALFQSSRMLMLSIGTAITGSVYNGFYAPIGLISGFCILMAAILIVPLLKEKTNAKELSGLAHPGH